MYWEACACFLRSTNREQSLCRLQNKTVCGARYLLESGLTAERRSKSARLRVAGAIGEYLLELWSNGEMIAVSRCTISLSASCICCQVACCALHGKRGTWKESANNKQTVPQGQQIEIRTDGTRDTLHAIPMRRVRADHNHNHHWTFNILCKLRTWGTGRTASCLRPNSTHMQFLGQVFPWADRA